jgi:DnaK suppressor protein
MKKSAHKINKLQNKKKKAVPKKIAKKVVLRKPVKTKVKIKVKAKVKVKVKVKVKAPVKAKVQTKTKAKSQAKTKVIAKKKVMVLQKVAATPGQNMFGPANVKPYQAGQNEEYMSREQLEHFRMVLLQWKSQLMAEVDRTMHHMQDESSNYPDPVDRASQEEEFNLELRARDRERKLLRKIEETLSRINDNDYGYCDDCGAEVGIRRLEARPTATQCIECKTIAEIREKQVGEGS